MTPEQANLALISWPLIHILLELNLSFFYLIRKHIDLGAVQIELMIQGVVCQQLIAMLSAVID